MAGPAPHIVVAAPSQLGLSVADLKRLRLLVVVVCVLFGVMHCSAWVLSRRDAAEQRVALRLLMSPECGCSHVDGFPIWRLKQEPITDSAGVHGSAVVLARIMGIPFVRLAVAMPERMRGVTSLQAAVGRVGGLSVAALRARTTAPDAITVAATEAPAALEMSDADAGGAVTAPRAEHLLRASSVTEAGSPATNGEAVQQNEPAPDLNEVASTALCHALQLAYCFGDNHAVAEQQIAYLRRLRNAGMDVQQYQHLFAVFKEVSIGAGLRASSN